jgi:hypothetical protein
VGLFRKLDDLDRWSRARTARWDEEVESNRSPLHIALGVGIVIVPAMVILLFQTVRNEQRDNRVQAKLEQEGVVTAGTVEDVRSPLRWNVFPSTARIEFTTDTEERVSTWVPVSHRPEKGAHVEVRYSRTNPSIARFSGDESPHGGRWKLVAIGGPVFSVGFVAAIMLVERLHARREGRSSYWTGGGRAASP